MPAPGYQVTIGDASPSRFAAESTAVWFVEGFTDRGPTDAPVPIRNLAEYIDNFGGRVSYGQLYDALDTYFHEGGGLAYVTRVVGPSPVKATHILQDASNATCLTANAKSVGAWGNNLSVAVSAGVTSGTVILTISESGDVVEISPELADCAAAIAWALASSSYIDLVQGGSTNDPKVQTVALAGGADDRGSADDTVKAAALELATDDYGPGQVSAPGFTTSALHEALMAHGEAHNRTPILDDTDTGVAADLAADAVALQGEDGGRRSAVFGPWVTVPGIAAGTTRTVPPSALVAALIARLEAEGGSVGDPAAGDNGIADWAIGLSQSPWSEDDRETLNNAGFNVIRIIRDDIKVYAWRTLADPVNEDNWLELNGARTVMSIAAQIGLILERYVLRKIDGRGRLFGQVEGDIIGVCSAAYDADDLFGDTPEDAFLIDLGPSVNTPTTIANRQLNARVELKTSPFVERAEVVITKTRSDSSL